MTKHAWQLAPGVKMDEAVASEVYKIACGLKGLALHSELMIDREDCPEDLRKAVDDGVAAIAKIFTTE
jgi:hypothetical protein